MRVTVWRMSGVNMEKSVPSGPSVKEALHLRICHPTAYALPAAAGHFRAAARLRTPAGSTTSITMTAPPAPGSETATVRSASRSACRHSTATKPTPCRLISRRPECAPTSRSAAYRIAVMQPALRPALATALAGLIPIRQPAPHAQVAVPAPHRLAVPAYHAPAARWPLPTGPATAVAPGTYTLLKNQSDPVHKPDGSPCRQSPRAPILTTTVLRHSI